MGDKGLGRGLDALMSSAFDEYNPDTEVNSSSMHVSIDFVSPNIDQPRKEFDEDALTELSESIKEKGIIQPILVEKKGHNKYIIIAGERRYRASKKAGLEEVPIIIKEFINDQDRLEVALIENIQRENLTPIEEAIAYKNLMEMGSLSQEMVAKKVGKKRSTVANALRLLKLPEDMQKAVTDGEITSGHARALLSVINPADQRILYNKIITNGLSVREAERMAQDLNKGIRSDSSEASRDREMKKAKQTSAEIIELQQQFIDVFGTKVTFKGSIKKGKIEIAYYSQEDLERIYDVVMNKNESE